MISPIDKISPITQVGGVEDTTQTSKTGGAGGTFGSIFRSAVDNVIAADKEKSELQYQLSVGELDNPSLLMISSSKYQIAVDLLIQLRNKALDAYSELTRISL